MTLYSNCVERFILATVQLLYLNLNRNSFRKNSAYYEALNRLSVYTSVQRSIVKESVCGIRTCGQESIAEYQIILLNDNSLEIPDLLTAWHAKFNIPPSKADW